MEYYSKRSDHYKITPIWSRDPNWIVPLQLYDLIANGLTNRNVLEPFLVKRAKDGAAPTPECKPRTRLSPSHSDSSSIQSESELNESDDVEESDEDDELEEEDVLDGPDASQHHGLHDEQTAASEPQPGANLSCTRTELQLMLALCLFSSKGWTSPVVQGQASELPNPLLSVSNVGLVGLPVTCRDMKGVLEAAGTAPDSSSHTFARSCDLPANLGTFRLLNADFDDAIADVGYAALCKLGFATATECKWACRTLTITQPGREFQTSCDKADIVTLAVDLPSETIPEACVFSFDNLTAGVKLHIDPLLVAIYTAALPGVHAAHQPTTSGYRCTLTYEAPVTLPVSTLTASILNQSGNELTTALRLWDSNQSPDSPKWLVFDICGPATCEVPQLKDLDWVTQQKLKCLSQACSQTGTIAALGVLERFHRGSIFDRPDFTREDLTTQLTLRDVATEDGEVLVHRMQISRNDLVDPDGCLDLEHSDEGLQQQTVVTGLSGLVDNDHSAASVAADNDLCPKRWQRLVRTRSSWL